MMWCIYAGVVCIVWLSGLTLYTLYLARNMSLVNPDLESKYKDI